MVGRADGSSLAADYLAGAPGARAFFAGWSESPESYLAKAQEIRERFDRPARERAASAMRGRGEAAARRLDEWVDQGGYLVTTGQQAGLFTGPLYTIYKALTAVRLASALEPLLGAPVLPLFWVASEDHDWDEANHTSIVGVSNELRRVSVEAPTDEAGHSLHRVRPGAGLQEALTAFLDELPKTEFSQPFIDLLEGAYAPGSSLVDGFHATLGALMEPFGLYLVDAADPVVKAASSAVLAQELRQSAAHEQILSQRALALEAEGYTPQVTILPGAVNLFLDGDAGRERLYRSEDGAFHLRHSGKRLTEKELIAQMEAEPKSLSPNVLLRPVVESAVFPTVSLVVGPGEAAYLGQLQPYFEAFGIQPPVAYPRFVGTAVETKVRKVLDAFELDVLDLRRPFHEVAAELTRDELPPSIQNALEEIRAVVARESTTLSDAVQAIHTTLTGPIQRAESASLSAWSDAEKKILQALKRANETRLAQLEKARLHLFPDGKPQERVLNVFYYLFRYGDAFLEVVANEFDVQIQPPAPRLSE